MAAGEPLFTLVSGLQGLNAIALGDVRIPVQPDGSFWVHYSHHDPDRFISAVDVLDSTDDASKIEKSIVLVGVTGLGLVDRVATPLGKDMVGIEVHAQVLENIFERSMLARPAWMRILEAALFALIAAIVIYSVPRMPPKRSPVIPLACGALLAAEVLGVLRLGEPFWAAVATAGTIQVGVGTISGSTATIAPVTAWSTDEQPTALLARPDDAATPTKSIADTPADPWEWLEEVTGEKALEWVKARNEKVTSSLASSDAFRALEARILSILDSKDRIPMPGKIGRHFYNFWRDAKNPKGVWRRTTLEEYRKPQPAWVPVQYVWKL